VCAGFRTSNTGGHSDAGSSGAKQLFLERFSVKAVIAAGELIAAIIFMNARGFKPTDMAAHNTTEAGIGHEERSAGGWRCRGCQYALTEGAALSDSLAVGNGRS